jgi:hypothetical protein
LLDSHLDREGMMENLYLKRYAHPALESKIEPSNKLGIVIAIPAYKEENLLESLKSLSNCEPTNCEVLVLVLINQPEKCDPQIEEINCKSYEEAKKWAVENRKEKLRFEIIWVKDIPKKHAGVGLARKIAMDEAVRLFEKLLPIRPNIHEEGVIVCFDADCLCNPNYLQEIEKHFLLHKECPAAVIYYEHPLDGDLDQKIYDNIAQYELFLRYHVDALRFAGFPYAYQTVGSCMVVRSSVYQKQGGMNKKQAGEDFYFLQKVFPIKGFAEISSTRVIPSPRCSDRVPFGTGRAIGDMIAQKKETLLAYHPQCYIDLKKMIDRWEDFFKMPLNEKFPHYFLPQSLISFLDDQDFVSAWMEMRKSSPTPTTFYKKFFHWFNGFRILKYIHFARDRHYPSIEINEAASWLIKDVFQINLISKDPKDLLLKLRSIDKAYNNINH